jgi:hypothetical protein
LLTARMIARIENIPHLRHTEPFFRTGGASSDVDSSLTSRLSTKRVSTSRCLFRVLQRHYQALVDKMRWHRTRDIECAGAPPPADQFLSAS